MIKDVSYFKALSFINSFTLEYLEDEILLCNGDLKNLEDSVYTIRQALIYAGVYPYDVVISGLTFNCKCKVI